MPAATKRTTKATDEKSTTKADNKGVGIAELAKHLGTEPRLLRAFLCKSKRSVGKGGRYSWPSLNDPEAQKIAADWKAAKQSGENDE